MFNLTALSAEGGRRTNRFSPCSHCVLLGSFFLWLYFKQVCVSWLCFGVATFIATDFFMVVLVVSLLHGLAWVLLHVGQVVFSAHYGGPICQDSF